MARVIDSNIEWIVDDKTGQLVGYKDYSGVERLVPGVEVNPVTGGISLSVGGRLSSVEIPPMPPVVRMAFIGDSITASDSDTTFPSYGQSWALAMALNVPDRIVLLRNVSIGGQTSAQMAARFDADVLTQDRVTSVWIASGTNDTLDANGYPTATEAAHVEMIRKAREFRSAYAPYGLTVFMSTTPPFGTFGGSPTASDIAKCNAINKWKRQFCRTNNIPLFDIHAVLVDKSGTFKTGYTSDGVHPTDSASRAVGIALADEFKKLFYGVGQGFALPQANNDPLNGFDNGLFVSVSGNRPTGITVYGDTSSIAESTGEVAGYRGNAYALTNTGASATFVSKTAKSSFIVPGKRYRIYTQTNLGDVQFKWTGGPSNNVVAARWKKMNAGALEGATFVAEVVAPDGVTGAFLQFSAAAGGGALRIAGLGIYDVTDEI